MITLEEVLQTLVARTYVSSNFGAMIEKMASGTLDSHVDPTQSIENMENNLMRSAPVLRFLDELRDIDSFDNNYHTLNKVQKKLMPTYSQGAIVIYTLRNYQEWSSKSQERGLANVYSWINKHNKSTQDDLRMTFAKGSARKSRKLAIDLYTDCIMAVADQLKVFNNREKKREIARKTVQNRV